MPPFLSECPDKCDVCQYDNGVMKCTQCEAKSVLVGNVCEGEYHGNYFHYCLLIFRYIDAEMSVFL